jgi:transposase-like protein
MSPRPRIARERFYSVTDFNQEFATDDACLEYIKEQRCPNGVTRCEKCSIERKHHRVTGRTAYACDHCGNHIYPLSGTVFAKSATSLKTWFYVIYLMCSTNSSISAKRIQRETGVTYKTAWRTLREIRRLLNNEDLPLERPTAKIDDGDACGFAREGESAGSLTAEERMTSERTWMGIASD